MRPIIVGIDPGLWKTAIVALDAGVTPWAVIHRATCTTLRRKPDAERRAYILKFVEKALVDARSKDPGRRFIGAIESYEFQGRQRSGNANTIRVGVTAGSLIGVCSVLLDDVIELTRNEVLAGLGVPGGEKKQVQARVRFLLGARAGTNVHEDDAAAVALVGGKILGEMWR